MNRIRIYTLIFALTAWIHHASANDALPAPPTEQHNEQSAGSVLKKPLPDSWTKQQSLQLESGQMLQYDVATGAISIASEDKKSSEMISYIAYFAKNQSNRKRPVTFCFNGGPGSSSIWLHIAAFGPKIASLPEISWTNATPKLSDNPFTLLQTSDLIFVDPVGTGFIDPESESDATKFFGVDEDISASASFIQSCLTKFRLWDAPKFLLGESYGALRVTGIAAELLSREFTGLQGLIFVSGAMDMEIVAPPTLSDRSAIVPIPTYAALARHFEKLPQTEMAKPLLDFLSEVEAFCVQKYAPALLIGTALSETEKEAIAQLLSQYIGLPKELILQQDLRISPDFFAKTLLKSDGRILGRFDGRYTSYSIPGADGAWFDPSLFAVAMPLTNCINEYLATLLKENADNRRYVIMNDAAQSWNWKRKSDTAGLGYTNAVFDARFALTNNPEMRLFVAAGIYDLAVPYFDQELTIYRLLLPKALQKNISIKRYRGGHMIYLNPASLKKLSADLCDFISPTAKTL